ncbi:hypothetical protein, partial [Escherichia coli]|uniref:hypothetical protein n=1 Tax=Escherichia coli TaxID=562 RepID=UPI001A7E15F0
VSIKNDGHYFCRAGGNRPDGLNEPVTFLTASLLYKGALRISGKISKSVRTGNYVGSKNVW